MNIFIEHERQSALVDLEERIILSEDNADHFFIVDVNAAIGNTKQEANISEEVLYAETNSRILDNRRKTAEEDGSSS